jgi:hypothetical protein
MEKELVTGGELATLISQFSLLSLTLYYFSLSVTSSMYPASVPGQGKPDKRL